MNNFNFCLMNPPFSKDLHLDFLDKVTDICNKSVVIEPGQWLVQLKENGKYTKENSIAEQIKHKIENHVKSIEINNYNKAFKIANKTVCAITTIDFTKEYNEIDFECVTEKSKVSSLKDCNLIGEDRLVSSILKKCKNYKEHMIDHIINTKKYKEYEDKGYYFLRYGNYMLDTLGSIAGNNRKSNEEMKCFIGEIFRPYIIVAAEDKPIINSVPLSKNGNPCDSVYGLKNELENWKYFINNNKLPLFINICLTIDEQNNSREYIPWLVDKKYTDEEIYKLLDITKEEQELINKTIEKFKKGSKFGKGLYKY